MWRFFIQPNNALTKGYFDLGIDARLGIVHYSRYSFEMLSYLRPLGAACQYDDGDLSLR